MNIRCPASCLLSSLLFGCSLTSNLDNLSKDYGRTSGGTSSGGTSSGGTSSGGGFFGPGCAGQLLFCDDFEASQGVLSSDWTIDATSPSAIVVDRDASASGSQSVRIDVGTTAQRAFFGIATTKLRPNMNRFYGRMNIRVDAPAANGSAWTMIEGSGPWNGDTIRVGFGGDADELVTSYDSAPRRSNCLKHSTTPLPIGQWTCVEWLLDAYNNVATFWLDGAAISDLSIADGDKIDCAYDDLGGRLEQPALQLLSVGWSNAANAESAVVRIDDVAFDISRIGCPVPH